MIKMIKLIIIGISMMAVFCAQNATAASSINRSVLSADQLTKISVHDTFACAVQGQSVNCFFIDDMVPKIKISKFKNPRHVSLGKSDLCVLDDDGPQCFELFWNQDGSMTYGPSGNTPKNLKNPSFISVGDRHICAIDEGEVKCGGSSSYDAEKVPSKIKNPRLVSAFNEGTCVLHDGGLTCWGYPYRYTYNPDTYNLHTINAHFLSNFCADDGDKLLCLTGGYDLFYGPGGKPPQLKNPKSLSMASYGWHTCVIDDDGVKCWRENDSSTFVVPEKIPAHLVFKNPRYISSGTVGACLIDDDGVKCWNPLTP